MIIGVESAIVLLVPEAQALLESAWNQAGAPPTGMPAHVTLLYPFVPDPDAGIVEELRYFFAGVDGFALSFSAIGQFPEVLYLAPDQPEECRSLTDALVRRWPGFPPYDGKFEQVVPHLSVVKTGDAALRDRVRTLVEQGLPVRSDDCEASLWVRDADAWRQVASFPMGPAEP